MPLFSERMGITPPKTIQRDAMDLDLRTSLWNVIEQRVYRNYETYTEVDPNAQPSLLYRFYWKKLISDLPEYHSDFVRIEREAYFELSWYKVYDYVEFILRITRRDKLENIRDDINLMLEIEKSAYRVVDRSFVSIIEKHEIKEIEDSSNHIGRFTPISSHIKAALKLYAQKPHPDYRNTIKEAISAVEATVRIISGSPTATLGEALKKVNTRSPIHEAMMKSFLQLYGYTSDEGGIRHSMIDEKAKVEEGEARYMLVCCSAFCNYLIGREG